MNSINRTKSAAWAAVLISQGGIFLAVATAVKVSFCGDSWAGSFVSLRNATCDESGCLGLGANNGLAALFFCFAGGWLSEDCGCDSLFCGFSSGVLLTGLGDVVVAEVDDDVGSVCLDSELVAGAKGLFCWAK